MDEDAFLRTIASHPDDDGPRLVYADWLDESGRNDQAEFIRLQCELVSLDEGAPREELLTLRAEQLLDAHDDEWLGPLAKVLAEGGPNVGRWFRRGFVETIILPAEVFLRKTLDVFSKHPVRFVTLTDAGRCVRRLAGSPCLARLAGLELSLAEAITEDAGFRELLASPHLDGLREFGVLMNGGRPAVEALAAVPGPTGLRLLRLAGLGLGNLEVERLIAAPCLRALTELDLDNNDIDLSGVEILASCPALAKLTAVRLDHNPLGEEAGEVLAASRHLLQLCELSLYACAIGDPGIVALCAGPLAERLITLDVSDNALSSESAGALAASSLSRLQRLDLSNNPIGDDGVQILASAEALASLTDLRLNSCGVSDTGVRVLAASAVSGQLHRLELDAGRNAAGSITDDGATALAAAGGLTGLTRLSLRGQPLSNRGRELLRECFGRCLHLND